MALRLDMPVRYVKGVGPVRASEFEQAGIRTVEDLLRYPPFRYEDRTRFSSIGDLQPGREAVVAGRIITVRRFSGRSRRMKVVEVSIRDTSGFLPVTFFNQPYLGRMLKPATNLILYGTPRTDPRSGRLTLTNPELEVLDTEPAGTVHTGRIVPVYRRIGSLTTRRLRSIIFRILEQLEGEIEDPLPESIRRRYRFPPLSAAFQSLHFPVRETGDESETFFADLKRAATPFQRRFIFEEFFSFQTGLEILRSRNNLLSKDREIRVSGEIRRRVKSILPFHPTRAQKKVVKEIIDDLQRPAVMHRLLQGDVGSGKTVVALQAIVVVIENGYQAALMAPTEILAEQHFRSLENYLKGMPYRMRLLTGSLPVGEKRGILERVSRGEIDLLVGTHALIQEKVQFAKLGLAVIDEQHRFGVAQRYRLMKKGMRPDTLVMTATPIPRSLALTVYGDLDLSLLDELPPGRKPVRTLVRSESSRNEVYALLRDEIQKGRQVYIVYPLVEESEKLDLGAASVAADRLRSEIFPEFRIGLLHGKLKADEKEQRMREFARGRVQILVATTVVEVGIDVPNATVMVVENAERFGLSQLHQLRGRVGRGRFPGLCILMTDRARTPEAWQRLELMRKSSDGFEIAEKDLEIRGPGEFLGKRQSGLPAFRFGHILRDRKLLELARCEAESCLEERLRALERNGRDRSRAVASILGEWRQKYGYFEVG